MAPKEISDNSSDDGDHDFDEQDLRALEEMVTDDEDPGDENEPETEFRNGSPTGPLMTNIEQLDFGKKPCPIEYDDQEEVDFKTISLDSVVFCKDEKTNFLFRAVLYLMPTGGLVFALVTDKEKAWKLALHVQKNKKNVFKKKDEDMTIKRSVPDGKPWTETDFTTAVPVFCTPSAQYKMELRKANAKAAKAKASALSSPKVNQEDCASAAPEASPAPKKVIKPAPTDAPKKKPTSRKRIHAESVERPEGTKRSRQHPSDVRTLSAPTDHPIWEFIDAAKVAMEEAKLPGGSLVF